MSKALEVGQWYTLPGIPDVEIAVLITKAFLKYPEWITQRDTENRLKKKGVIDHLRKLFPTHHIVAVGELTEQDDWEDKVYEAGHTWRLDANTRAKVWERGLVNELPKGVLAVKFKGKTLKDIRNIYWAFDNPTAAEIAAEVVSGCLKSLGIELLTKKFKDGQFVTALSYTCKYDAPDVYGERGLWSEPDDDSVTITEYKRTQTLHAVRDYADTIKAVDELLNKTGVVSHFDQTFLTALFLFHRKYGCFDDNVTNLCLNLTGRLKDEDGEQALIATAPNPSAKLNATGWIDRENTKSFSNYQEQCVIQDRGKMDGFYQGVPFFTYWLSIASQNGLKHRQNKGAKGGYTNWFENTFLKINKRAVVEKLEKSLSI